MDFPRPEGFEDQRQPEKPGEVLGHKQIRGKFVELQLHEREHLAQV